MSRPSQGVALMTMLAVFVLLASNIAANLGALPLLGVPIEGSAAATQVQGAGVGIVPPVTSSGSVAEQEILSSLIVLGLLFGFALWRVRKTKPRDQEGLQGLVLRLAILGFFIALMVGFRAVTDLLASTRELGGATAEFFDPSVLFYASAALAISVIAVLGVSSLRAWSRRDYSAESPGAAITREFSTVLHDTVYSLRTGSDRREVVLDCYKKLCAILQEGGAADSPELTAREFEAMATEKLSIRTGYLHRMTLLFEKARYSTDDVDDEDTKGAEESLEAIGRELQVRPRLSVGAGGRMP